jgi:hypothetical protein
MYRRHPRIAIETTTAKITAVSAMSHHRRVLDIQSPGLGSVSAIAPRARSYCTLAVEYERAWGDHRPMTTWYARALAKIRINGELHGTPTVLGIGASGEMLGEMPLAEALRLAMKEGLDLVEVNPEADPPVCKLLDLAKYKYDAKRAVALARRDNDPDDEPA